MHHQRAKTCLVKPLEVEAAHRPSGPAQRFGDGRSLRGNEIARSFAAEISEPGHAREICGQTRALARRWRTYHRDQVLARAVHEKLQLTVLVDGTQTGERGGTLTILAEAL